MLNAAEEIEDKERKNRRRESAQQEERKERVFLGLVKQEEKDREKKRGGRSMEGKYGE